MKAPYRHQIYSNSGEIQKNVKDLLRFAEDRMQKDEVQKDNTFLFYADDSGADSDWYSLPSEKLIWIYLAVFC